MVKLLRTLGLAALLFTSACATAYTLGSVEIEDTAPCVTYPQSTTVHCFISGEKISGDGIPAIAMCHLKEPDRWLMVHPVEKEVLVVVGAQCVSVHVERE